MGCFTNIIWLVVSTLLKNISQLGLLFPIYRKTHVPNHQPANTSWKIDRSTSMEIWILPTSGFWMWINEQGRYSAARRVSLLWFFLDDNEIGNLHQKSLSSILKHGALAVSISVSEADICSGWHSFFNGIPGEGSGRLLVRDSRWQQEVTSLGPQEHILTYLKNLTQTQNYGWFGVKDYGKVTLSLNRHPQEAGHTLMTNSLVSS